MEKFILSSPYKALLLLGATLLVSCSGVQLEEINGIDGNTALPGHNFGQYDNAKISGTGGVRFNSPVPNSSSRSLSIKVSLDQTLMNSSIKAVFYSADLNLGNTSGVIVAFNRSGASVNGTISINGTSRTINSSRLTYYYPASLDLVIEVHNVNSRSRVLIWRRDRMAYTADTADVDSERSGDLNSFLPSSTGAGTFNGLQLEYSTVSAALIGLPKLLD